MATYDLEEQEQLAELKAWWKQYGNLVFALVIAALLVLAAWNGWRWHQRSQAAEAGMYFDTVQKAARANDLKALRDAAGTILEKFPGTAFAPLAALVSARAHFQSGDLKTTRAQLQWAVDHAKHDEVRWIARLRLASASIDDGAFDEALKVLDPPPAKGFESLVPAMRGDIFAAQNKPVEAVAAYKSALEKAETGDTALRESIKFKLDALGGA
ncbi:MAG: tetratricopeptide repeat protein [Betaproteobacteria bacterium]|nr:tetratricopeptide repeat protein [Betaproteobacteria bacterium]